MRLLDVVHKTRFEVRKKTSEQKLLFFRVWHHAPSQNPVEWIDVQALARMEFNFVYCREISTLHRPYKVSYNNGEFVPRSGASGTQLDRRYDG